MALPTGVMWKSPFNGSKSQIRRHTGRVINGEDVIIHFKICWRQIAYIRQLIRYLPSMAKKDKAEIASHTGRYAGLTAVFSVGPVGLI